MPSTCRILENAIEWLAWRKLRNRLVHEYFQETAPFAGAVAQSLLAAPKLVSLVEAVRLHARKAQAPV